nr:MAG TPA: Pollen allergen Ole e 6-helix protein, ALLERGEN [Caudoviricetes sp.]
MRYNFVHLALPKDVLLTCPNRCYNVCRKKCK